MIFSGIAWYYGDTYNSIILASFSLVNNWLSIDQSYWRPGHAHASAITVLSPMSTHGWYRVRNWFSVTLLPCARMREAGLSNRFCRQSVVCRLSVRRKKLKSRHIDPHKPSKWSQTIANSKKTALYVPDWSQGAPFRCIWANSYFT